MPATLKIVKVLIEELQAAGGNQPQLTQAEIEKLDEAESDDGDWEDDPDTLDLGLNSTKAELMAFAEEEPGQSARGVDEETGRYLVDFFKQMGGEESFEGVFAQLNPGEQERLREMVS